MRLYNLIKRNIQRPITKFWYSWYRRDVDTWVFGEWFGERCNDNCMFFVNYVSENYPQKHIYWIAKEATDTSLLNVRVKRVLMDSVQAIEVLKKAGAVFFVQSHDDVTSKDSIYYSGALTVNLWHGIPWKKIGFDVPMGRLEKIYLKFNSKMYDGRVYVSASDRVTESFRSAFDCDVSDVIKAGSPRNSVLYDNEYSSISRKRIVRELQRRGIEVNNDTLFIVYMPTFRDKNAEVFSFSKYCDIKALDSMLSRHNAVILEKMHYVTIKRNEEGKLREQCNRIINIGEFSAMMALSIADMLVTDYSSCFFDYLLTDRPVVHYLYDYDYYANSDRGVYYDKEDVVCGDIVEDEDQLLDVIEYNLLNPRKHETLRQQRRREFLQYEDKLSCERIYKYVCERIEK